MPYDLSFNGLAALLLAAGWLILLSHARNASIDQQPAPIACSGLAVQHRLHNREARISKIRRNAREFTIVMVIGTCRRFYRYLLPHNGSFCRVSRGNIGHGSSDMP